MLLSYGALACTLAFGPSALESQRLGYAPYFCALATLSIYIGSHRALTRDFRETISFESSLAAPVALSCSLFAVYFALEVLHLDLGAVVGTYFFVLGGDRCGWEQCRGFRCVRGMVETRVRSRSRSGWVRHG